MAVVLRTSGWEKLGLAGRSQKDGGHGVVGAHGLRQQRSSFVLFSAYTLGIFPQMLE